MTWLKSFSPSFLDQTPHFLSIEKLIQNSFLDQKKIQSFHEILAVQKKPLKTIYWLLCLRQIEAEEIESGWDENLICRQPLAP